MSVEQTQQPEARAPAAGPSRPGLGRRLLERLPRGTRAIAWTAILTGLLAAWIALPPATVRSLYWSLALGLVAVTLGAVVIVRRDTRFGVFGIVAGLFGIGLAILAQQSSVGNLESVVIWSALFAAMLRYATPLIFASIGGLFSERSGVVNIGLEGMMLMGAFFGIYGADKTGSWVLGLLIGIASGALLAAVHAFFSIHLRADQIVGGTAINFLALGITGYLFIDIYGQEGTPTDTPSIPNVNLGFVKDIPFLGDIFGNLNLMIWLALLTVVLTWVVMFRTPIGLRIRSVGEHPRAADTVGINVYAIRYGAVILSGALAAAGGAYLSIGFVNSFNENMTAGRGFIALAALIFGNWRPFTAAAACLLFGFSSALAQRLAQIQDWQIYSVLFQALPYVLTLIAVAGVIGRSIPPAAVGRPYKKQ
ncbi:MAG TPA: ABC transporter permease [Gaiellaceae bacterium]|nr:ABC transporter permease [Gaiellaceae bacterium]